MQRAGNGLSEIIYSDIGMLLDVMWKLKGTCVLTSHDEEQYQQLRRMYTCNILVSFVQVKINFQRQCFALQVWSREYTHFNFSILCPIIHKEYSKWIHFKYKNDSEREKEIGSLGHYSAVEDCKKDLNDKVNGFLLNFALTLFKLSQWLAHSLKTNQNI